MSCDHIFWPTLYFCRRYQHTLGVFCLLHLFATSRIPWGQGVTVPRAVASAALFNIFRRPQCLSNRAGLPPSALPLRGLISEKKAGLSLIELKLPAADSIRREKVRRRDGPR